MQQEKWEWIGRYENYYKVSTLGRFKAVARIVPHRHGYMRLKEKLLTPWIGNQFGHLYVTLTKNGEQKHYSAHRLVLETFVGPCPEGMEACHFPDRNPANNNLDNLRWGTPDDNKNDMKVHGTSCRAKSYKNVPKGETHPHAKLSDADVEYIKKRLVIGKRGIGRELASMFNVSEQTICDIKHNRTRRI